MRTFAKCSGDFVTLMTKTREETKAELTGCAGTDWELCTNSTECTLSSRKAATERRDLLQIPALMDNN